MSTALPAASPEGLHSRKGWTQGLFSLQLLTSAFRVQNDLLNSDNDGSLSGTCSVFQMLWWNLLSILTGKAFESGYSGGKWQSRVCAWIVDSSACDPVSSKQAISLMDLYVQGCEMTRGGLWDEEMPVRSSALVAELSILKLLLGRRETALLVAMSP